MTASGWPRRRIRRPPRSTAGSCITTPGRTRRPASTRWCRASPTPTAWCSRPREEIETKKTFLEDNSQHPRKVMIVGAKFSSPELLRIGLRAGPFLFWGEEEIQMSRAIRLALNALVAAGLATAVSAQAPASPSLTSQVDEIFSTFTPDGPGLRGGRVSERQGRPRQGLRLRESRVRRADHAHDAVHRRQRLEAVHRRGDCVAGRGEAHRPHRRCAEVRARAGGLRHAHHDRPSRAPHERAARLVGAGRHGGAALRRHAMPSRTCST